MINTFQNTYIKYIVYKTYIVSNILTSYRLFNVTLHYNGRSLKNKYIFRDETTYLHGIYLFYKVFHLKRIKIKLKSDQ